MTKSSEQVAKFTGISLVYGVLVKKILIDSHYITRWFVVRYIYLVVVNEWTKAQNINLTQSNHKKLSVRHRHSTNQRANNQFNITLGKFSGDGDYVGYLQFDVTTKYR